MRRMFGKLSTSDSAGPVRVLSSFFFSGMLKLSAMSVVSGLLVMIHGVSHMIGAACVVKSTRYDFP